MLLMYFEIFRQLATDLELDSSDRAYFNNRLVNEGPGVFLSTLPTLVKHVLVSLNLGHFYRPTNFAWKGRSLRVLRSLLDGIFNPDTGCLQPSVDPIAFWKLRQLSEYMYKTCVGFSDPLVDKAIKKYTEIENEMQSSKLSHDWAEQLRKSFEANFSSISSATIDDVMSSVRPRFGPGSIARDTSDDFVWWQFKKLPIEDYFIPRRFRPFSGWFRAYPGSPERLPQFSNKAENRVCEVLFVPKNMDTCRTISREPWHLSLLQMAFFDWITPRLQSASFGRIQFVDQGINRGLAKQGSLDGTLSTLDLEAASDRVQYRFVKRIFRNSPAIRWFITNARSTHARLPNGELLVLEKLAGMGSGLTFPIMSLLIHLSICTFISHKYGLTYWDVGRRVNIFGDDVAIPEEWYEDAILALEKSGLKVNVNKSFHTGPFRESCGGDYVHGVDVAPVRLRLAGADLEPVVDYSGSRKTRYPHRRGISVPNGKWDLIEAHCRELVKHGLTNLAGYYYRLIERVAGPLPYVSALSPVLGRVSHNPLLEKQPFENRSCLLWKNEPKLKGWVRVPEVEDWSNTSCPYKRLGQVLAPGRDGRLDAASGSFGEVAVPRRYKLKRQLVSLEDVASMSHAGLDLTCVGSSAKHIPDMSGMFNIMRLLVGVVHGSIEHVTG